MSPKSSRAFSIARATKLAAGLAGLRGIRIDPAKARKEQEAFLADLQARKIPKALLQEIAKLLEHQNAGDHARMQQYLQPAVDRFKAIPEEEKAVPVVKPEKFERKIEKPVKPVRKIEEVTEEPVEAPAKEEKAAPKKEEEVKSTSLEEVDAKLRSIIDNPDINF